MLDFIFIFTIFLEIVLTVICSKKLIELEKKVSMVDKKLKTIYALTCEINTKIKGTIGKINKFVSIITNKKLIKIRQIIKITINVVQIIILIKSLNFSKGLKSINYKNIKRLLFAQGLRQIIKNIFINLNKLAT